MYEQVEKPKENKSRAVANSVAQKKSNVKQDFGFVDNRPEIVAQMNLKGESQSEFSDERSPLSMQMHLFNESQGRSKSKSRGEVVQREWVALPDKKDEYKWDTVSADGVQWFSDENGVMWYQIEDESNLNASDKDSYLQNRGGKKKYEEWNQLNIDVNIMIHGILNHPVVVHVPNDPSITVDTPFSKYPKHCLNGPWTDEQLRKSVQSIQHRVPKGAYATAAEAVKKGAGGGFCLSGVTAISDQLREDEPKEYSRILRHELGHHKQNELGFNSGNTSENIYEMHNILFHENKGEQFRIGYGDAGLQDLKAYINKVNAKDRKTWQFEEAQKLEKKVAVTSKETFAKAEQEVNDPKNVNSVTDKIVLKKIIEKWENLLVQAQAERDNVDDLWGEKVYKIYAYGTNLSPIT